MPDQTPSRSRGRGAPLAYLLAIAAILAVAAKPTGPLRAKPPKFSDADRAAFFDDAFSQLVGERPDFTTAGPTRLAASSSAEATADERFAWSRWISTDTLESEIKRQTQAVTAKVASSTTFKSGGFQECRDAFSALAVMFAVSAEHDEQARWRDTAAGLASLIARVAANCKVGTDNSFREATARSEDLTGLIRGSRPDVPPAGDDQDNWGRLADRGPLMQRIELAWQDRLGPLTANERAFKRGAEDALHEAQLLATLAEVLTRDGFDDAGDEDYDAFCRNLRDAAADISRAAEQEDYAPVREAYGRVGKSCTECHESYRG